MSGHYYRGVEPPTPKKYRSCAQWELEVYNSNNGVTTDDHYTGGEAGAVCTRLQAEGFGGMRIHFPLRTWTEPIV